MCEDWELGVLFLNEVERLGVGREGCGERSKQILERALS